MVEDGSLRVLEILSRASSVIAEGEVHQLMTANDTATTEAAYLEVIEAKTAALFAAASRVGAILADRPPDDEEALDRFGHNLGIAVPSWSMTCSTFPRDRPNSARPSATISATARYVAYRNRFCPR